MALKHGSTALFPAIQASDKPSISPIKLSSSTAISRYTLYAYQSIRLKPMRRETESWVIMPHGLRHRIPGLILTRVCCRDAEKLQQSVPCTRGYPHLPCSLPVIQIQLSQISSYFWNTPSVGLINGLRYQKQTLQRHLSRRSRDTFFSWVVADLVSTFSVSHSSGRMMSSSGCLSHPRHTMTLQQIFTAKTTCRLPQDPSSAGYCKTNPPAATRCPSTSSG